MLKKINAILAFVTAALSLCHIGSMGLMLFEILSFNPVFSIIGKVLVIVFALHVIISLFIMFFFGGNGIQYPKLNKSTVEQRIASIVLLVLLHFHATNYISGGAFGAPSVFGYVTEILFVFSFMCHFMPSVDKGLLTLGISSKAATIPFRFLFLLALLLSLSSVSVYFLGALI